MNAHLAAITKAGYAAAQGRKVVLLSQDKVWGPSMLEEASILAKQLGTSAKFSTDNEYAFSKGGHLRLVTSPAAGRGQVCDLVCVSKSKKKEWVDVIAPILMTSQRSSQIYYF